ncbi:N-acetyltransferase [bacterium D16-50]|jgi:UDP-4-amino-4,6-dideoxy-N-acetyl-beta-L-altrosamine N-acetyltransferase|nr:GNAT family N-acetyltransferase [Lachnospiraceae bacterium]RKJ19890.1 N-acetyltransferase [bacterium D16-50]
MDRYVDEGAGIFLRPMTHDDTELIIRWRNSEAVRRNFIYQKPFTREGHENWIRTMIDTKKAVQLMICEIASGRAVGSVYIRDIDREHNKAEYGIFIGEAEARGRGIGTGAAKLMLRYCFQEEKLHRVYLRALAGNDRAVRSYEKAGFVKEACLKDDVFLNGKYCDIIWMAAIAPAGECRRR